MYEYTIFKNEIIIPTPTAFEHRFYIKVVDGNRSVNLYECYVYIWDEKKFEYLPPIVKTYSLEELLTFTGEAIHPKTQGDLNKQYE